jgi:hypothetical protein
MPVVVHCPKCGTRYQLGEELAGRQAKCRCGQRMTVPLPAARPADSHDRDPEQAPPSQRDASSESAAESLRSTASILARAARDEPSRAVAWIRALPTRTLIGILSIGYGGLATLLLLGHIAMAGPFGMGGVLNLFGLADLVLAVLIVVAGVRTLKGDEHGPAFAGICCIILCFFPFIGAVQSVLTAPPALRPGIFLWRVLRMLIIFPIPIFIAVWALRQEIRKERESERDERGSAD